MKGNGYIRAQKFTQNKITAGTRKGKRKVESDHKHKWLALNARYIYEA